MRDRRTAPISKQIRAIEKAATKFARRVRPAIFASQQSLLGFRDAIADIVTKVKIPPSKKNHGRNVR